MQIQLNGQPIEVPEGLTFEGLVQRHQLNPQNILVERNATALHRSEWSEPIKPNDIIEFIKVVAGG